MPSLKITLPPDVYESLSFRAERAGRSLAQQAIADLRTSPDLQARTRRLRTLEAIRQWIRTQRLMALHPPPEDLVREDRSR